MTQENEVKPESNEDDVVTTDEPTEKDEIKEVSSTTEEESDKSDK